MNKMLNQAELSQYAVNIPGKVEQVAWSLFDYTTYAAAGQTQLQFFQNPVGQGGKTFVDTNMVAAGQVPSGQNFVVQSVHIEFFPGENPEHVSGVAETNDFTNDTYAVMKSGLLTFTIGSKPYLNEGPIGNFPPTFRMAGHVAYATTVAAQQNAIDYSSMAGEKHDIIPLLLTSNQNFLVTLNWPAVVALPSAVAARIGVRLKGILLRNAQ